MPLKRNMPKYTEGEKQQVRDFVKEGLGRVCFFMETTMGLPHEITLEKISELETLGEQMMFLNNFYKDHPKLFKDMPHFKPEHA